MPASSLLGITMNITLNGAEHTVPENCRISELLNELGLADKRVAVEVNREIIPRSEHINHQLKAGDIVEVVNAIGGGER